MNKVLCCLKLVTLRRVMYDETGESSQFTSVRYQISFFRHTKSIAKLLVLLLGGLISGFRITALIVGADRIVGLAAHVRLTAISDCAVNPIPEKIKLIRKRMIDYSKIHCLACAP